MNFFEPFCVVAYLWVTNKHNIWKPPSALSSAKSLLICSLSLDGYVVNCTWTHSRILIKLSNILMVVLPPIRWHRVFFQRNRTLCEGHGGRQRAIHNKNTKIFELVQVVALGSWQLSSWNTPKRVRTSSQEFSPRWWWWRQCHQF